MRHSTLQVMFDFIEKNEEDFLYAHMVRWSVITDQGYTCLNILRFFFDVSMNSVYEPEHLDSPSLNICIFSIEIEQWKTLLISVWFVAWDSLICICVAATNDHVLILMKKIVRLGCHLNWITEKLGVGMSITIINMDNGTTIIWKWKRAKKRGPTNPIIFFIWLQIVRILCIANYIYAIFVVVFFLIFGNNFQSLPLTVK